MAIYIRKFYSEDVSSLFSYLEKERGRMASSFSQMFVFLSENGTSIFFFNREQKLSTPLSKRVLLPFFFEISSKKGAQAEIEL